MSLVKIQGNASGTGEFTIAAPNSNTNRTLTLPDATGTLNTSGAVNEVPAGSASAPSIYPTGDTNTGIFFPAADTIGFAEGGAEVMRIDSSGNLAIGATSASFGAGSGVELVRSGTATFRATSGSQGVEYRNNAGTAEIDTRGAFPIVLLTNQIERARIDSSGNLLVGTTSPIGSPGGIVFLQASGTAPLRINRTTDDGVLVIFYQAGVEEGTISVSGSTVSYNGGHLSRWAQMLTKPDLLKGTVMSNLDEMNVYIAPTTYWTEEDELPEGVNVGDVKVETHEVENEQLNKVKVSDVEGDVNVAGVFVNWTYDEQHQVDEINMAMTGDMIIRIAQGVVVQKGDLLMSAGDGTAKPQDDDIVRSKTVAKVTSNHVTCTYEDGSYCVPCVLMAC
jgi:hypothetical protein